MIRKPSNSQQNVDQNQKLLLAPTSGKKRGELAELAFLYKAVRLGFAVSETYGDSDRYDFIVRSGEHFWKVQVKSSSRLVRGSYPVDARRRTKKHRSIPYTADEIDFVAAYVAPEDAWFVIPIQSLQPHFQLYPRGSEKRGPFDQFREAWYLME